MLTERKNVLFVDDDPDVLKTAQLLLKKRGFTFYGAANPGEAVSRLVSDKIDLVLLDLNFSTGATSGEEGLVCLRDILRHDPMAIVIVITGHSGVNIAVQALRDGARDFIMKPWNNDRLVEAMEKALSSRRLGSSSGGDPSILIGNCDAMRLIISTFDRCSPITASVLLTGEAGTGKTLAGKMIHRQSGRPNLKHVEAHALTLNDLSDQPDTTLLLENIDRLSEVHVTALQDWLAQAPILNSRLVSTTTQNISNLSLDRGIRYAISTIEVEMPPLRERGDDVVQLAEHFVRVTCQKHGFPAKSLSLEAKAILGSHTWPDNIHALRRLLERTIILLDGILISAGDLALESDDKPQKVPAKPNLAASEKAMIEEALKVHNFNVSAAANQLGLTRPALYRRMWKHGL